MDELITLAEQISVLFAEKNYTEIRRILAQEHPADCALLLQELPEEQASMVFRLLPKELGAEVFVNLESDDQEFLLKKLSDTELRAMMDELFLDDAADMIDEMPANVVSRILAQTDPETRKALNTLLNYPEDSAGSVMTTEYVRLGQEMTVSQAFDRIRATGVDKETIYTCYVTTPERHLVGVLSVRDLLLADPEAKMKDIMNVHVIFAETTEDKEDVAHAMSHYDLIAIPVVDKEHRLVGIVTYDDAIDVLEEEATEDIEKMAAITPSEKPYLKIGVWGTWKQRIPWLLLLMVSATFTGGIISSFEKSLAVIPALIAFIPMLMDTGGNSGGQSSVTVIRGMAVGEIEMRDMLKVLWKEVRVAALCGLTLACVNFVKILLVDNLLLGSEISMTVAAVVCLTLAITVVIAKAVGCTLPMAAKKLGFDPAVMASPFITTIVDALALLIYFRIAVTLLPL